MRYQKIESRIWNDERFIKLSPLQQRLFIYILTCPHGNLIGLFVLKKGYIIEDLKVLPKDLERDLQAVLKTGMIEYDDALSLVWVIKFLKHNPLTNPNQKKAVPRILSDLPKSYLIQRFIKLNESTLEGLAKDFETPFEVNPKPESESDTETEAETERGADKPKKKRQTIPIDFCLTDQLIEFAKSQGINGNIQTIFDQFKDHHTNKGTLGLDWPAAWRTWVRNEIKFNSGKSTQSFTDKVKSERDAWMRERGLTQS